MNILLVDDHKMMRDGLRALLEREGMQISGEAGTGHEAMALARRLRPDVVVMDISMPGLNGIDATRRLLIELPQTKIIGLSMNSDSRYVAALLEVGACGYLLKNSASDELIQALHAVMAGVTYVSSGIERVVAVEKTAADKTSNAAPASSDSKLRRALTPREREVLRLVAEGKSSKDVAVQLGLAVATVETHRRQIMDKLELRTIAELTKYAIREGLTSVD